VPPQYALREAVPLVADLEWPRISADRGGGREAERRIGAMNRAAAMLFVSVNLAFNYGPLLFLAPAFARLGLFWPALVVSGVLAGIVWTLVASRAIGRGQRSTILWAIFVEGLLAAEWVLLAMVASSFAREPWGALRWAAPYLAVILLGCAWAIACLLRCQIDPDRRWERAWMLDYAGLLLTIAPFGCFIAQICGIASPGVALSVHSTLLLLMEAAALD
jgi:hypothetical protein